MSSSATHHSLKATRTTSPTTTHTTAVHAKSIRTSATTESRSPSHIHQTQHRHDKGGRKSNPPSPSPSSSMHKTDESTVVRPPTTHKAETSVSTASPHVSNSGHRDGEGNSSKTTKTTSPHVANTVKTTEKATLHKTAGGGGVVNSSTHPPIVMPSPSPSSNPSEPAPIPQPSKNGGDFSTFTCHRKGQGINLGVSEGKPTTITTVVSATPTTETMTTRMKIGGSSAETTLKITTSFGGHTITMTENPTSTSSPDSDSGDSSKIHLWAIVGSIVGVVIVSTAIFWLCTILRRRHRQTMRQQERGLTNTTRAAGLGSRLDELVDIDGPTARPMSSVSASVLQTPPNTVRRKPVPQLIDVAIPSDDDDNPFTDPAYDNKNTVSRSSTVYALSVVEEVSEAGSEYERYCDSQTSPLRPRPRTDAG